MSLTSTEKATIIFYLGWPAKTLIAGSTHYDKTVADRLNLLDADSETLVRSCLTSIAAVRTKLDASTARMQVKKVGDIELNVEGEHSSLVGDQKRLFGELSNLLDIPTMRKGNNIGVRV